MSHSLVVLCALAIGPALVLAHVIYAVDRREREPVQNVLRYVFRGALAGLLAAVVEVLVLAAFGGERSWGPIRLVLATFLGIALVEEGCKLLLLRNAARRDAEIDEPFDWIVYAVAVALGFATLENLVYVLSDEHGVQLGVIRALTAVPGHALNGTLMGDRLARAALVTGVQRERQLRLALWEPTAWHGLYDCCALGCGIASDQHPTLAQVLGCALIVVIAAQWVVGVRRVRHHHRAAPACLLPPILYPVPKAWRVVAIPAASKPPDAEQNAPAP